MVRGIRPIDLADEIADLEKLTGEENVLRVRGGPRPQDMDFVPQMADPEEELDDWEEDDFEDDLEDELEDDDLGDEDD